MIPPIAHFFKKMKKVNIPNLGISLLKLMAKYMDVIIYIK